MEVSSEQLAAAIANLVTEDDTPVDNFPSEKQQRLLTEPLYSSQFFTVPFIVAANVGLFYALNRPPLVPDAFLSLNVQFARDWWQKQNRSYFFWEFGKPPEVVIEIVSNTEGNERGSKLSTYATMQVPFYGIYDPLQQLKGPVLEIFELSGLDYVSRTSTWLESVGIGLTLWQGEFEGREDTWLRWCDREGQVVPSGAERAAQERARADALAERLRQLGIDPNDI